VALADGVKLFGAPLVVLVAEAVSVKVAVWANQWRWRIWRAKKVGCS
jgi:hypothetical protein